MDLSPPILEAIGVSKSFSGIQALQRVDFDLRPGEVHVLLGENGAGKSTLINLFAGTFAPDEGQLKLDSRTLERLTPVKARSIGISPVFQEFSLIPELTVSDNLFLGREIQRFGLANRKAIMERSFRILGELGFDIDPRAKISHLSRAQQQMVEIAKALLIDLRVLILDEPTASLTDQEAEKLFGLVEGLRRRGVGIIYITHRMHEIRRISDRTTVLRDGKNIATVRTGEVSDTDLVQFMTGRKIDLLFPRIRHEPGRTLLQAKGISLKDRSVADTDFEARAGEITGIAGLVGCGKSSLVRSFYGIEEIAGGSIELDGRRYDSPSPGRSLERGMCYFPADRSTEGLALSRPIRENMTVAALRTRRFSRSGLLRRTAETRDASEMGRRLKLRPDNVERPAAALSGGNRQKVMLARGLARDFNVFLFDEPTVGIDVGAKAEIYELMKELTESGAAVVVVSSDLAEVIHLSNRVYVMRGNKVSGRLEGKHITEAEVLRHFFGSEERGMI